MKPSNTTTQPTPSTAPANPAPSEMNAIAEAVSRTLPSVDTSTQAAAAPAPVKEISWPKVKVLKVAPEAYRSATTSQPEGAAPETGPELVFACPTATAYPTANEYLAIADLAGKAFEIMEEKGYGSKAAINAGNNAAEIRLSLKSPVGTSPSAFISEVLKSLRDLVDEVGFIRDGFEGAASASWACVFNGKVLASDKF